jgi:hypothetical protein
LHLIGDFVQAFTFGAQFEVFVMDAHNRWNIENCRGRCQRPTRRTGSKLLPVQSSSKRSCVDLCVR